MPTPPPPPNQARSFMSSFGTMYSTFSDAFDKRKERKAGEAQQAQLQETLTAISTAIKEDPQAYGIKKENAELASQLVAGASKSQFAQYINFLGPGIFQSKSPSSIQASLGKSIDLIAEGKRTGDQEKMSQGYELAGTVFDVYSKFRTTQKEIDQRFESGEGKDEIGKPIDRISKLQDRMFKLGENLRAGGLDEKARDKVEIEMGNIQNQLDLETKRLEAAKSRLDGGNYQVNVW